MKALSTCWGSRMIRLQEMSALLRGLTTYTTPVVARLLGPLVQKADSAAQSLHCPVLVSTRGRRSDSISFVPGTRHSQRRRPHSVRHLRP